ncbi:MAG: dihydrodipicolinate reductase [Fibrobacteres bacterium]|nr:dihydrodipicolinate reductase [Fibrobacterota bacterium]
MRVGLIGFGKTGKAVAATLLRNKSTILEWVVRKSEKLEHRSIPEFLGEESDEPGHIYSSNNLSIVSLLDNHPVDIIIDFSSEEGINYYGIEAAERGIGIISAVSHYREDKISFLKKLSKKTAVFWSPNITLGINYLMLAAKFLKKIAPHIDMAIIEEHFKDKPGVSGTAKVIAKNLDIKPEEIKSVRAGGIIGKHEILCGFPFQTVRLIHESITREAFGNGAIFAANNLRGKEAGLYTFEELLMPYFAL